MLSSDDYVILHVYLAMHGQSHKITKHITIAYTKETWIHEALVCGIGTVQSVRWRLIVSC